MRKILLMVACAATVAGCETTPQKPNLALSGVDPKYNSPECRAIRDKPYDDGTVTENVAAGAMTGVFFGLAGGAAVASAKLRKRELFDHQVELACMTNPPAKPHLDPSVTAAR
jgi:hypothetical protein